MGVRWSTLHVFPEDRPYRAYWQWKGEVCRAEGVELFFDDSPDILEHIPPETIPFLALNLQRHKIHLLREAEGFEDASGLRSESINIGGSLP